MKKKWSDILFVINRSNPLKSVEKNYETCFVILASWNKNEVDLKFALCDNCEILNDDSEPKTELHCY